MGRRLFNGRSFSEDGWPYVDQDGCSWGTVPGTSPPVRLQIQKGFPFAIMMAWAADWNEFIERLRDADSASWTPGNSVATSNHPGATACDLNWENHAFGRSMAGFNAKMQADMKEMEDFYEGNMFWAQRWFPASYVDPMHSQMGYGTYDTKNDRPNDRLKDFCARKIRADGFSTFRRGNAHIEPPKVDPAVQVLIDATGLSFNRAQSLLFEISHGLVASNCNNPKRIAMWLAQIGLESGSFVYTEEIAKNGRYAPYIGRTWIQITWESNYAQFSEWCYRGGLVPNSRYFVDKPQELAQLKWAGLGAAWYWTIARPKINAMCDAGDLIGVTKAINGGLNGLEDPPGGGMGRRTRYNKALALGDRLMQLIANTMPATPLPDDDGEDEMGVEENRMVREMYEEFQKGKTYPSRSFFAKDSVWGESVRGYQNNMDGNINELYMAMGYLLGVTSIEADVEYIAANGIAPASWAANVVNEKGQKWLAEVGQQWCQGLMDLRQGIQRAAKKGDSVTVQSVSPSAYREIAPAPGPVNNTNGTIGQSLGSSFDSLRALPALTDQDKALLTALTDVLHANTGDTGEKDGE